MKSSQTARTRAILLPIASFTLFALAAQSVLAQTTVARWANPATVSQSNISSTNGSPLLYLPANPYAVGDLIYFNGTSATANPFGTTANRYYVIYSSGNNIKVATTYNGAAVNAVNSITATGTAQQHPDWLTGVNWTGGTPPNDNGAYASLPGAGGGTTPGGGVVINGNVTVYGLGWVNLSQDLAIFSGSSNNTSLYPITFATSDGTTPKITCTNATGGVIFLGHSSQAASLKINGTQGLIFNAGPGGAVTGSGIAATSTSPSKDIRPFNTIDWSGFSGGIQIERGQVSQQNGTSTLGFNQTLTVGNNQTIANNLLAGFELNGRDCTLDGLNGNSLGRVYNSSGNSILKVGNNNGSGNFAGVIGRKFDGTVGAGNVLLDKTGTGTQTISGLIAASAGSTVTVDGGTLVLTGTNGYGGATTVNAGKLVVSSGQLGSGSFTVANGATLDVSVSGASQLQPSTLTLNSTATTLEFLSLGSTSIAPLKPGTLAVNGAVTVNVLSGTLASGNSYPLVNWTTISGTGAFVLGTCPFVGNLSTNGSTLMLNITAGTNVWTGLNNGNWDTSTTGNWLVNGSSGTYVDASLTVYDDTAAGTTNVTLNQVVKPGAISVNNSLLGYTITSAGGNYIGGAGSLTKTGSSTLTLSGPNTYSGGTILSAGQLNINYGGSNATNSAIGTGPLTIAGGTLDNASAGDVTLAPAIAQSWAGDFSYAGSAHALNLGSGAVTLTANRIVTVTNNTLAIGGSISDGGSNYSLSKNGNGSLALLGASTFSGGLALNAGTVKVGSSTALGTGTSQLGAGVLDLNGVSLANANVINNAAFVLTNSSSSAAALAVNSTINSDFTIGVGTGNITVARLIAGATRTVTKQGAGTLVFSGSGHNNLMAVVVNNGTLVCGNAGGFSADRGLALNGGTVKLAGIGSGGSYPNANLINDVQSFVVNNGIFDLNGWNETVGVVNGTNGVVLNNASNAVISIGADNGSATFAGSFQNGTGTLAVMKVGTGTQTLTGTNTYTGGTIVSNGILQAGIPNAFPTIGGDMTLLIGSVIGVLDLNGFDNAVNGLNGGGTIDTVVGGMPTLKLGVNGTNGTFNGTIQNTAGTLSVLKVGAGTQVLAGQNNYSGTTTVSNGTLTAGSSLNGGAVTVYGPGTLNVSNSISVAGSMTLANTGAKLSLLDNSINSVSLNGGLTLTSGNVLKFDISNTGADTIYVSGAFNQSGTTTINVNQLTAPNSGTYTLISGASGINAANFTLGNTLSGYTLSLSSDGTSLYLNVSLTAPAAAYWRNRVGTAWNGNSGANYNWDTDQFSGTSVSTFPAAASDVYFAASAASSFSTTLGADFGIKSLTFNVANNVTVAGPNVLTVGGPITVNSGAGSNVISVTNLVLGVDQNISVADAANTLTISAPVTGAHALNVSGSGTVALAGVSSFSGGTTVSSGTLALKNATNSLPDAGSVNISGGTLDVGTNNDTVGAITLSSGSITGSSGMLKGASYNFQSGTVTANLGGSSGVTINGGTVLLGGSNSTYSGGTTISSGTLQVGANSALGSGNVTIANGTYLDLNGQTIPNTVVYAGGATLANNSATSAAITADGTVNGNFTIDTTGGNITTARLIGAGTHTLLKTGGNTLTFNGAGHNNQVKLQVQGGTVVCGNNGGYSADRGFELDYGTVKLAGPGSGGAYPNANLFNDGQQFYLLDYGAGTSFFDLNGWNETVAAVYGTSGATILNNAAGTNSTLTVGADNGTAEFSGAIGNGAGVVSITKIGTGAQTFSGPNSYSGNTTINNGQLYVTASAASTNSTFVVNTNGLLFHTDAAFTIGGLAGGGDVSLLADASTPIALAVGANNASTTHSGVLSDNGLGATLTKVGAGTLTLLGANTYTGLTTVSNGALIISPNYIAGGNVTVKEGAVFGVTGNSLTTSAQVGTLNLGISGSGSSTIMFKSLPAPANAPLTVSTLNPIGGAGSVIISNNAVLSVGTYNLINYTNLGGVGFGAFTLAGLPPGTTASLFNNTAASPKVIQLVVSAIAPETWSGAVNTNWDVNTTANWKVNSVATNYSDFSPVLFDDSATGPTIVNLATNVQPSSVVVSNITKNYTLTTASGSGLVGSTALTKNGSGTLTFVNVTNSFTGGVAINAGVVVLSSATLGSNNIVNNGTLMFSNGTHVVSSAISGAGPLVQNGTGSVELAGANTFSGGVVIKSGTVQSDNTNALGTGIVTLGDGVSANNATLLIPAVAATFGNTNPVVVAAGGAGAYRIQFVGNPDYHLSGGIALSNALTLSTSAGGALFVDAPIVSSPANPALTVDGNGSTTKFVYLTAANSATFTGNVIVTNKGTLKSGNANSLSAANSIAIDGTSALDNGGQNLVVGGLNDFGGSGGTVAIAGNAGVFLTLGGSGTYSFSGVINNTGSLLKNGAGTQTFSGANTYAGVTTVSNGTLVINGTLAGGAVMVGGGTLSGTGILHGPTTVSGGTLSPAGTGLIGVLAISNSLTLQVGGTVAVDVNKATGTNDLITGLTSVTYGGTLVVNNLSGSLTTTDSFKLFSAGSYNGAFASITPAPGAGLAWNTNTLATDGVLRISTGVAMNPTNIAFSVSGNQLTLTWPGDHQGWILQAQTNTLSAGLGTNWIDVPNSGASTQAVMNVDSAAPTVFFRLRSP